MKTTNEIRFTRRIKTKKEFEDEITIPTWDWRREFPYKYIWKSPEMDLLFGMKVTEKGYKQLLEHRRFNNSDSITQEDCKEFSIKLNDNNTKIYLSDYLSGFMYHSAYFKLIGK